MTSYRSTFTLQPEAHAHLQRVAPENKSAYINKLLLQEHAQYMKEWFARANREEMEDLECQELVEEWDVAIADGLDMSDDEETS